MRTFAKLSMGSNSHESWADDYANEVAEKEVDKAIKEEREACAKIAEEHDPDYIETYAESYSVCQGPDIATKIRARSQRSKL